MTLIERAATFDCAGEDLVAIFSEGSADAKSGVIVIVGGPQYRVGSHRQFVLLARRLARDGIPAMRFDYRGMGDSGGRMRSFDAIVPDIAAAIEAFTAAYPSLKEVVLWGLCDAASAALLYWQATQDPRVAGMVLLNPWVRSEETLARTQLKHYYGQRLLQGEFWTKLFRGRLDLNRTLRSFARSIAATRSDRRSAPSDLQGGFQDRMALAMARFAGPILLILSGRDLTAKEFLEYAQSDSRWHGIVKRDNVETRSLPEADHTFSAALSRGQVETLTLDWLKRSFPAMLQ